MNFKDLVVSEFHRLGRGWSGGGTIANGYFYEAGGKEILIARRDLTSGKMVGEPIVTKIPTSIHDLSYDHFTDTLWCSPGGGLQEYWQITMSGRSISKIPRPKHGYGICCANGTSGMMWCADQENNQIVCISTITGSKFARHVPLNFPPRGVAKVGSDFWVTYAGGQSDPGGGHLYRVDATGKKLNDFDIPGSVGDDGGLSVDDEGCLWMVGGKKQPIYRIDIKKVTGVIPEPVTPPSPSPVTPPEEDVIENILRRLNILEEFVATHSMFDNCN